MTELTKFEEGISYWNRIGQYEIIQLIDKETMLVHCIYDGKERVFNQRIAQLTIFNMNRGR